MRSGHYWYSVQNGLPPIFALPLDAIRNEDTARALERDSAASRSQVRRVSLVGDEAGTEASTFRYGPAPVGAIEGDATRSKGCVACVHAEYEP
jgi:hypothetical protein